MTTNEVKLRRRLTFRLNERSDVAEATISEVLRRRLTREAMLSVAAEAKVGHPQAIIKRPDPELGLLLYKPSQGGFIGL